ncbi:RNA 2',3'-cyclic phosphodiesterase [Candidatus Roizmanbacteria bacterium]|nr:RNA 2',3'-cyclic phosphodiesterase [Candidatus Roizmanbacteria bacterium]
MRLFLAIDLPSPVKSKLAGQLEGLKKEYPYFRWVREKLYHITVQFFGTVENPKELTEKIKEASYDATPFHLYSQGAEIFLRRQIVLHLSFQRSKQLEVLVRKIRDKIGKGDGRRFVPHLTFARYKIPSKQQYLLIKKKARNLDIDIDFSVKELTLFDSVIEEKRPVYKVIKQFRLR